MTGRHLCTALLLMAAACDTPDAGDANGDAQLTMTIAPLSLTGITNARYQITVRNLADDLIIDREIDADTFGDGTGSVVFVGPCDAQSTPNELTVTLLDLYEAPGQTVVDTDAYRNPGALVKEFACQANEDVRVDVNLVIARAANQGFFDVAVSFDDVFCSAKLDCVDGETGLPLQLLHNDGVRDTTAVLGLACTSGAGTNTTLYRDDVVVDCDGVTATVDPSSGPGQIAFGSGISGNATVLFGGAVYSGSESLGLNKVFWNVLLGLTDTANCTVTTRATASDGGLPGFTTPSASAYPYIDVNVTLTNSTGGLDCGSHPLDGVGAQAGVSTRYTPLDAPVTFGYELNGGGVTPAVLSGISCAAILAENPTAGDGFYTLDLDDTGPGLERSYYCDMSGGGWTQVLNQRPAPGPLLPDDQATVGTFGDNANAYRLGGAEISSIVPATAWRFTDSDDTVYFRPQCVVDWANDFTAATEPEPKYCTRGFFDLAFTAAVGGGSIAGRGIGVNGSCQLRGYFTVSTPPNGEPGNALDCNHGDGINEPVGMWFR